MGQVLRWLGQARKVAQVDRVTLSGTWEANDEIAFTINNKTLTVVAGSTDPATILDTLVTAWNNETTPEFAEITAAELSTLDRAMTLTADTPGKPFTLTVNSTESSASGTADSQTATHEASFVENEGPWNWDHVDNWSPNRIPVSTDDVVIEAGESIKYGLAQSAVTLDTLVIKPTFSGTIGLPTTNADGTTTYDEYRETYLAISATTVTLGQGDGQGSARIKLDTGSNATTVSVFSTGSSADTGLHPFIWKGTHATNVMNINKGFVDVAPFAGEVATIATLRVGYLNDVVGDSRVVCSGGVTLTTIEQNGGDVEVDGNLTTWTQSNGTSIQHGGDITTLNLDGGVHVYSGTGTITTGTVNTSATLDFSKDLRSRTVTNVLNIYSRATVLDPSGVVTFSGGIKVNGADVDTVTLKLGNDKTLSIS